MPLTTQFYINEIAVNPTENWRGMSLQLNFDKENGPVEQVTINDWDLVNENADIINNYIDAGVTGGPGILEGLPFRVDVYRGNVLEKPHNGYLDLSDDPQLSKDICRVKSKERKKTDWLNDVADGFTFELLAQSPSDPGYITSADYKYMPYVINSIPDYKDAAVAILTVYVLETQIKDAIEKITELIAELANPFEAVTAILRAAFYIAYVSTLIIAIVKLIKDIVALIVQPVKYHAVMSVKTLLEKGCAHLGLTFRSSIFENTIFAKAVIMPEKYMNPANQTDNRILGFTVATPGQQEGFFKGTFGNLLRFLKTQFNAKVVINDSNELYFERRDYNITTPLYQIPDASKGGIYQPFHGTNASEFRANYYVKFQTDSIEKNTFQEYTGTGYQVTISPDHVVNQDLVLMKGLETKEISFSLAKRKTDLTVPEKIIKAFLDVLSALTNTLITVVNTVISIVNAITGAINSVIHALGVIGIHINFQIGSIPSLSFTNLGNIIDNRINMMKLETDFTSGAKIFLMDEGTQPKFNKLNALNESVMSAEFMYEHYHYINSFYPTTDKPNGNQYIIKTYPRVPFSIQDYQNVKDNNNCTDFDGTPAIIESIEWNPYDQVAAIRARISKLLTNNLVQTILIPDGR